MTTWKSTAVVAFALACALGCAGTCTAGQADLYDRVKQGYAVSDGGVKIHYASLGEGPLVVMIHGFPDFWYSWRRQMEALADRFQVVAIDQRGDDGLAREIDPACARRRLTLTARADPRQRVSLDDEGRVFNRTAPISRDQPCAFEQNRAVVPNLQARCGDTGDGDDHTARQDPDPVRRHESLHTIVRLHRGFGGRAALNVTDLGGNSARS